MPKGEREIKIDVVVNTKVNISFWEAVKLRIAGESARLLLVKEAVSKAAKPVQEHVEGKAEKILEKKND